MVFAVFRLNLCKTAWRGDGEEHLAKGKWAGAGKSQSCNMLKSDYIPTEWNHQRLRLVNHYSAEWTKKMSKPFTPGAKPPKNATPETQPTSCTALKKTPLVYMVTGLICKCCSRWSGCSQKTAKMGKAAQSKEGEGGSSLAWRKMEGTDLSRLPARSVRNRAPLALAHPSARGFGVDVGERTGSGKGPMSSGSRRKPQRGRCWFGAASYFWRRIVYRLPLLPSKEKHLRQEDGQADQDHGRVGPGSI